MLVLNHRTAPLCPVIWAVRMSMSFPFAWQEVRWDPAWGAYRGADISGHTVVDGGMLSNFPIDLFMSRDSEVAAVMGTGGGAQDVIGFLIDETLPVPGAEEPQPVAVAATARGGPLSRVDVKELEVVARLKRMVDTVTQAHDKFVIDAYRDKVCRLPANGYGTLDFDLSDRRLNALVEAGYQATLAYFREKGAATG
jgi:predicted acylesterase/phospholipase RssA